MFCKLFAHEYVSFYKIDKRRQIYKIPFNYAPFHVQKFQFKFVTWLSVCDKILLPPRFLKLGAALPLTGGRQKENPSRNHKNRKRRKHGLFCVDFTLCVMVKK